MLCSGERHCRLLSVAEPWAGNNPMIKASRPHLCSYRLGTNYSQEYYLMRVLHILKIDSTFWSFLFHSHSPSQCFSFPAKSLQNFIAYSAKKLIVKLDVWLEDFVNH